MYEQIVAQIQQAIWSGELPAGASLPSLRRLARDLEVSLITTTRAYNDLAAAGRPGRRGGGGAGGGAAAHRDRVGPRRRGPGHLPRQDRAGNGDADGGAEMVDGEVHGCAAREGRRVPTGAGRGHVVPIARR